MSMLAIIAGDSLPLDQGTALKLGEMGYNVVNYRYDSSKAFPIGEGFFFGKPLLNGDVFSFYLHSNLCKRPQKNLAKNIRNSLQKISECSLSNDVRQNS